MADLIGVLTTLRVAKDHLRGRWCQAGKLEDGRTYCAATATIVGSRATEACRALAGTLGDESFTALLTLFNWNDAPGRTEAEVLDLYDRTIARLEARP